MEEDKKLLLFKAFISKGTLCHFTFPLHMAFYCCFIVGVIFYHSSQLWPFHRDPAGGAPSGSTHQINLYPGGSPAVPGSVAREISSTKD